MLRFSSNLKTMSWAEREQFNDSFTLMFDFIPFKNVCLLLFLYSIHICLESNRNIAETISGSCIYLFYLQTLHRQANAMYSVGYKAVQCDVFAVELDHWVLKLVVLSCLPFTGCILCSSCLTHEICRMYKNVWDRQPPWTPRVKQSYGLFLPLPLAQKSFLFC